jgi:hypothetical protein
MIYSRTAEDAGSVAVQNSTVFQGLNFTLKRDGQRHVNRTVLRHLCNIPYFQWEFSLSLRSFLKKEKVSSFALTSPYTCQLI